MASLLSSTELPQRGTPTGRASLSINRLRASEDFFHEENPFRQGHGVPIDDIMADFVVHFADFVF